MRKAHTNLFVFFPKLAYKFFIMKSGKMNYEDVGGKKDVDIADVVNIK